MKKGYILGDEETTFCVVKSINSSKARNEAFKLYGKLLGLDFIEFNEICSCNRFKELDELNFEIIDAVDLGVGTEMEHKEIWSYDEIISAVKEEVSHD